MTRSTTGAFYTETFPVGAEYSETRYNRTLLLCSSIPYASFPTQGAAHAMSQPRSISLALVAPSPVPFTLGGAENLWSGWLAALNSRAHIQAELIKLPVQENDFWSIVDGYRRFAALDLDHFDRIVSTKYPAWMVAHGDHQVLLQHKLRGLYDTWPSRLSTELPRLDAAPVKRVLRALDSARGSRAALAEIFASLQELQNASDDLPSSLFQLPGALIRRVVHSLDDIGLARQAIRRFSAISATVATREDYFPGTVDAGREVTVFHHPTVARQRDEHSTPLPAGAIFSASRLDGPKRMDWLIRAHREAGLRKPLYIAGDGPQRDALEAAIAPGQPVHLMGRISDSDLAAAYESAEFVAYVPDREDYGLITLEALQAGKAVLTCSDSGGVTELVRDGDNGLVVAPTIAALAHGLRRLSDDNALRARLAANARESVAHINWAGMVDAFATAAPRVAVINSFAIFPALSGGQLRMWHLYSELARHANLRCVSLSNPSSAASVRTLSPGLVEHCVPMSAEHAASRQALEARLDASCGDIAALLRAELTPAWVAAVAEAVAWADVVILSHPYGLGALRAAGGSGGKVLVYEAHNVEADLKAAILSDQAPELDRVREAEASCASEAARVFCCSADDAARLRSLYRLQRTPTVIPNGVDARSYPELDDEARAALRQRLSLGDRPLALFVGSLHGPNLDAALHIVDLAAKRPGWQFSLLGGVCDAPPLRRLQQCGELPTNVNLVGRVSHAQLRTWLAAADAGLNPVDSGSGTNLKLLEYAAAGLPILCTPFGGRGGQLTPGEHFACAELADFPEALDPLHPSLRDGRLRARVAAARRRAGEDGDWRRIATSMWQSLEPLLCE